MRMMLFSYWSSWYILGCYQAVMWRREAAPPHLADTASAPLSPLIYTLGWTMYTVHCSLYTDHYKMYSVKFTVYIVQCSQYIVGC